MSEVAGEARRCGRVGGLAQLRRLRRAEMWGERATATSGTREL